MTTASIQTLAEVLTDIDALTWSHALYLDKQQPWSAASRCAVLDPNDTEDLEVDDEPQLITIHDLRYALTVSTVQDIVDNTKQQRVGVSLEELIQAVNYYYKNDAFIEW